LLLSYIDDDNDYLFHYLVSLNLHRKIIAGTAESIP